MLFNEVRWHSKWPRSRIDDDRSRCLGRQIGDMLREQALGNPLAKMDELLYLLILDPFKRNQFF